MLGIQSTVLGVIGRVKYHFLDRNYIQTFRFALITTCLLLTMISGVLLVNRPTFGFMLLGGVVGLCVLILLYHNMQLGCILVLVLSTIWNVGIGSGTGTPIMLSLVMLLLLAGLWLFKLLLVERSFASVRQIPSNWPIILFALVVSISLAWSSIYVEEPVRQFMDEKILPRLMTAVVFIISPLATLIIANHVRSIRAIKFFTWWFIVYGAIVVSTWFLRILSPPFFTTKGQLPIWVSLLAVGQSLFNTYLPRYLRIGLLAVAGGWLYVQFFLQRTWVSGWLPLVLAMVGMVFWFSRRLFFVLLIGVGIYVYTNTDMFSRTIEAENQESGQTRVEAWDRTLQIVGDHFLFGTGPTGYYFYLTVYIGGFFQLSHNNYVDVIAQTGVVGFVLYIMLWIGFGWMALKTYLRVPKGGFRHGLAAAVLVAFPVTMIIMMLGDWVIPFTYTQTLGGINYTIWPWLLQGIGLALYFESRDLKPEESDAAPPERQLVNQFRLRLPNRGQ
jgi:O-antigen ligase